MNLALIHSEYRKVYISGLVLAVAGVFRMSRQSLEYDICCFSVLQCGSVVGEWGKVKY